MQAQLVSVNVSPVKTVQHGTARVTTAIYKTPVAGRVAVRGVNLAGDEQADRAIHGGPNQVAYAYAEEDYAWWETQLNRPLPPGTFGENLTTRGLDVNGAAIGEQWRIGSCGHRESSPGGSSTRPTPPRRSRARCDRARTSRSSRRATSAPATRSRSYGARSTA